MNQPSDNWHPDSDIVASPQLAEQLGLGRTPADDIDIHRIHDLIIDDPEETRRLGLHETIFHKMLKGEWPATPEQLEEAKEFVEKIDRARAELGTD